MTQPNPVNIALLSRTTGWYGSHSGYYEQLPRHLSAAGACVKILAPRDTRTNRLIGKMWSILRKLPRRNQSLTLAELRFHRAWQTGPETIGFIAAIEEHLPGLSYWDKAPARLIGAIHFPRVLWGDSQLAALRHLSSAIVLYQADIAFFEQFVGIGRVKFIHHGVDTAFFKPKTPSKKTRHRAVFCGQFGRDFDMLEPVALALLDRFPDLHIDLVIPGHALDAPPLQRLFAHPRILRHAGISDGALLSVYQNAALMLLPMKLCGANNAVVEALACGLPVLSTDVGGMRDYGGGAIFPLVAPGDIAAMIEEAVRLLTQEELRREIGQRSRAFAEHNLAWPVVAQGHLRAMRQLAENAS